MLARGCRVNPYYQDDLVTLWHGDCREVTAWLEADVLVTDPPYGIRWAKSNMHTVPSVAAVPNAVVGDHDTLARDAALGQWGARPAVVFGSWRAPRPAGIKNRLIWHKVAAKPAHSTAPWFSAEEEIYILGAGFGGTPAQNVIATREARDGAGALTAKVGHPTPKPVGLMERLISKCPAGTIADPFAGSGSTLIAAKHLGRRAVGVELEEKYCELAARRLAQDTLFGETA